mmetsp:Transcript_26395/g.66582  ORF Transcript_26395/g.66582 Transcript_26395/m.66582 type:complete len:1132 (+) Transcript_26395:334-3729(+)|eukprot:CAMPEP_0179000476 /NCGR_PEP_ID=MMETSP0795-20121207/10705_1 /TAXON_ID=88552 /ORGANISM="Amoebophrya sp., Strain Ameob2" /LENGTH=1131 /DNA_ID=CAMNT_0020693501 /DNA_START=299 /DNA_END=3697 /DNA_ORIENTATION=+
MPRDRLQKFVEREAEEGSDDEDDERDAKRGKYEDREVKETAELKELREEIAARDLDRNGETGANRLFGSFLNQMEQRALEEEKQERAQVQRRVADQDAELFADPLQQAQRQQDGPGPPMSFKSRAAAMAEVLEQGKIPEKLKNAFEENETFLGTKPPKAEMDEEDIFGKDLSAPGGPRAAAGQFGGRSYDSSAQPVQIRSDDPKLWCVKCFGDGVELCNTLMTKLAYMRNLHAQKGTEFRPPIFSAFASDAIKNYLYVEAYKEQELRSFLQGVRNLSAWDTRLVPEDEMNNVLRLGVGQAASVPHEHIKTGQFVRVLASGIYKGDIGRVLYVDQAQVVVRLRPRLDLDQVTQSTRTGTTHKRGRNIRPQAAFFPYELASTMQGVILDEDKKDVKNFGLNTFSCQDECFVRESGHLIKSFPVGKVDCKHLPTQAEKAQFSNLQTPEDYASTSVGGGLFGEEDERGEIPEESVFANADRIFVFEGQLKGITATVRKIMDNGMMMVQPHIDILAQKTGLVIVDPRACQKHFDEGQRVKVLKGKHRARIGTVIGRDGGDAVVAFDLSGSGFPEQVRVPLNSLKVTFESSFRPPDVADNKQDKIKAELLKHSNAFNVGDFVEFVDILEGLEDRQGVVTGLFPDAVRVLTISGNAVNMNVADLQRVERAVDEDAIARALAKGRPIPRHMQESRHLVRDRNGALIKNLDEICSRGRVTLERARVHFIVGMYQGIFVRDALGTFHVVKPSDCVLLGGQAGGSSGSRSMLALGAGASQAVSGALQDGKRQKIPLPPCPWYALSTNEGKSKYKGLRFRIVKSTSTAPYKGQLCEFRQHVDRDKIRVALCIKAKMIVMEKANLQIVDEQKKEEINDIQLKELKDHREKYPEAYPQKLEGPGGAGGGHDGKALENGVGPEGGGGVLKNAIANEGTTVEHLAIADQELHPYGTTANGNPVDPLFAQAMAICERLEDERKNRKGGWGKSVDNKAPSGENGSRAGPQLTGVMVSAGGDKTMEEMQDQAAWDPDFGVTKEEDLIKGEMQDGGVAGAQTYTPGNQWGNTPGQENWGNTPGADWAAGGYNTPGGGWNGSGQTPGRGEDYKDNDAAWSWNKDKDRDGKDDGGWNDWKKDENGEWIKKKED